MKLSEHFSSDEFSCKCGCGFDEVSPELIEVLEELREVYQQPITINSGCRCESWNKIQGGEPNSQHLLGNAADIVVRGVSPHKTYQYLDKKYQNKYGIGLYLSWVHVDVRKNKARWDKTH